MQHGSWVLIFNTSYSLFAQFTSPQGFVFQIRNAGMTCLEIYGRFISCIAFHDWLQTTNCSRYKATVLIFKGYMHTCTMLYLLLLHRIFTNHIATICSNSSEMVAQQGLMNPVFAYHTKGLTFLPSRGLYCSWLTARTNLRPDSGQLRSNLQPRYLYHLESRWRNSHVLVHHGALLSHLHLV